MAREYIFDTDSDLGRDHVGNLEATLDGPTFRLLDAIGLAPGMRCLDVGAGGGSVARGMAERVGPGGGVVAVDVATDRLAERPHPQVEVHRHDIGEGLPDDRLYDVVHARSVMIHLPHRDEVFDTLVGALAPGGVLVLGDITDRPATVLAAPHEDDGELFRRVQHFSNGVVGPGGGMDYGWAARAYGRMTGAGLVDVEAREQSWTIRGGDSSCLLHRNLNMQAEPLLLRAGATPDELERYRALLLDPRFRAWFYQLVYTWGRRPGSAL